jgi:hypothetical protein
VIHPRDHRFARGACGDHPECPAGSAAGPPGIPDRRPVRSGQVPALAHVERRHPVRTAARTAVPGRDHAEQIAARGHGGRVPLRPRPVGALSRPIRDGEGRPGGDSAAPGYPGFRRRGLRRRGRGVLQGPP